MRFPSVLALGCLAIDRVARTAAAREQPGASNVGAARTRPGGAARNVAEALARLGVPVALAGAVGDDADGRLALAETAAAGVDVALVRAVAGTRTASYTAILNGAGDLVIGVADMAVNDAFDAEAVREALMAHPHALIFADANLSEAALAAIAGAGRTLAACAVSQEKAMRLAPHLQAVAVLFLNRREARALTGIASDDLGELALALSARDVLRGVVTGGADGAVAWKKGRVRSFAAPPSRLVNANGAGDSLAAATLARWLLGDDIRNAAGYGVRAAAMTLESECAISPELTMARLLVR